MLSTGIASFVHLPLPLAAGGLGGEAGEGSLSGVIFWMVIALVFSFLCSLCEAVLLSTSLSHLEVMKDNGKKVAYIMSVFKENIDRPIAAILTLNTIAHTVGAGGAGAEANAYFGSEFAAVTLAILTLLILVLSEIIPKTIGAIYWKPLVPFCTRTIQVMMFVFGPFVWMFQAITRVMTPKEKEPTVSRSELEAMARISGGEGALDESEQRIITNLLHLRRVSARDVMTPRTVMMSFQKDLTVGEVLKRHRVIPYSRIPIYTEDADDIESYILRSEILIAAAEDRHDETLSQFARELHSVHESINLADVLREFTERAEHIFRVQDEHGGTRGILTLEDAIESLLGSEITDESDVVEDLRVLAQQRHLRHQRLLERLNHQAMREGKIIRKAD